MPFVTVLMAVFDPPVPMLEKAVHSVLAQTYADFEFLIVDDGSRTAAAEEYLSRVQPADRRLRVLRETHRGLTRSLNLGLALSRGAWIARHDADDWSEPDRLQRQVAFLAAHPGVSLCGSNAWTHQQDGRPLWRTNLPQTHSEIRRALPARNPFVHGATIFSRREALRAGAYREEFRCSQDYDLFWRLAEAGEAANLGQALYHYRYTAGSISAERAREQAIAHRAAQRLGAKRAVNAPCDRRCRIQDTADEVEQAFVLAGQELHATSSSAFRSQLKQADHLVLAGHYRRALRAYSSLIASRPGSILGWAKLGRLGAFVALPALRLPVLRRICFR